MARDFAPYREPEGIEQMPPSLVADVRGVFSRPHEIGEQDRREPTIRVGDRARTR
jgi:hypothetical protein